MINEGLNYIGESAFENSSLTQIEFPLSLESIGPRAFYSCMNLTNITFHNSYLHISNQAFQKTGLNGYFQIPSNFISIGDNAFIETNIISVYAEGCSLSHSISNTSFNFLILSCFAVPNSCYLDYLEKIEHASLLSSCSEIITYPLQTTIPLPPPSPTKKPDYFVPIFLSSFLGSFALISIITIVIVVKSDNDKPSNTNDPLKETLCADENTKEEENVEQDKTEEKTDFKKDEISSKIYCDDNIL